MTDYLTPAQKRALGEVADGRVYMFPSMYGMDAQFELRHGGARATKANARPFYALLSMKLIEAVEGPSPSVRDIILTDLGKHERESVGTDHVEP